MSDYQKQRVKTLFDPQSDPLGTGWNIIQSQTAIGSGGVYGKGWLNGVQSRLDFLPEGQTDFIVAVLAEEFGLLGMLFLLVSVYGYYRTRTLYRGNWPRILTAVYWQAVSFLLFLSMYSLISVW